MKQQRVECSRLLPVSEAHAVWRIAGHRVIFGVVGFLALTSAGCNKAEPSKGRCGAGGVQAEVSGVHEHLVQIPGEAVDRGGGGTYRVQGGEHEHAVRLSAADFEKLEQGETVVTRATSVMAHTHEITVHCPAPQVSK